MKYKENDRVYSRIYGKGLVVGHKETVVAGDQYKILFQDGEITRWITEESIERKIDMTKADLKDGMQVKIRDGEMYEIKCGDMIHGRHQIGINDCYDDELKHITCPEIDIVAIYKPIWQLKEPTAEQEAIELLKKHGYKIIKE